MAVTGLGTAGHAKEPPSVAAYKEACCKTVRLEKWMGTVHIPSPGKINEEPEYSYWGDSETI